MPKNEELPADITEFAFRNAAEVAPGRDFHVHMDRLIRSIKELLPTDSTRFQGVTRHRGIETRTGFFEADRNKRIPQTVVTAVDKAVNAEYALKARGDEKRYSSSSIAGRFYLVGVAIAAVLFLGMFWSMDLLGPPHRQPALASARLLHR
jgi:hypothetical protein